MSVKLLTQIQKILKKADISDLSRRTGYSYQYLYRLKSGRNLNPSLERIDNILIHLDYTFRGEKAK